MTVSQQTPVSNWMGNNSATEFPFNFYIEKESELLVEHTDLNGVKSTLENGVDYSIHEVGNKEGSYIIFPLAGSRYKTLAWDTSTDKKELLTLALTLPIEQSAEYEDSGDLSKKNLELSFDYAIRLIQILNRTISRAVKVNEGDEATPEQLIKSLNESKRIAVDAASTATSQAENAQNSAKTASEKADIAMAKATEVTETYNNAMADIQKDWQDAIDEIEEKQTTAETSITNLQSTAENTISNGIADIKSNKEQSMSAIDENRTTSIEEILANKTSSMNAIDKNRTDTLSEIDTIRSEAISNIEAVKTSAETSINDTKISAENSITDIKNTAISDVQNQESTTEANIDKKVQEALNKIPDIDDKLNVSKMYETGEISTDTTGYNQLVEMKHSTFDKSKFTVVSSPTITDDGIASGFNSVSNYLSIPNTSLESANTWEIEGIVTPSHDRGAGKCWLSVLSGNGIILPCSPVSSDKIEYQLYLSSVSNTWDISAGVVAHFRAGDTVKCNLKFTGTQYIYTCTNLNTGEVKQSVINSNKKVYQSPTLLGRKRDQVSFGNASSIDLKQFSITVDGKEVFSGNKTGTDTVKIGGETVEIPYTLSKTGSKIVDVAYRDKVQALYNQEGKADYYTIDETNQNFTLPMGEIYGMINSIKPSSGVELCTVLCMPFGVDESENKYRYLNGQTIVQSQYPAFTAKVKSWQSTRASLFTTETEWQAIKTASKLGQCGKFVIDDEAGTIRLPAIVNINGLTDLSKAGLIKDESLPAHKHTRGTMNITGSFPRSKLEESEISGSFYYDGSVDSNSQAAGGGGKRIRFSAARTWTGSTSAPDNATYQDGAPVQQEAVQYPYVICVNTGVEEAERPINNYQVNNTNSYGDNKYAGNTILNNLSWLRSVGQENPAGVHQDFFNWAIANIGQPFGAGLIKESTATDITEYDLVINQANQTFILPTLNGKEVLPQYEIFDTKTFNTPYTATENGFIYGLLNTAPDSTSTYIMINNRILSADTGAPAYSDSYIPYNYFIKRGDTYKLVSSSNVGNLYYSKAIGNGNLYYYVGDTLQNADLINIARMQEQITDINAQSRGYLVESYTDGTSGYRLYSDGFCEQRGYSNVDSNNLRTITFLKPYKDTNYVVTLGDSNIGMSNANSRIAKIASITTKNMVVTGIFNNAIGADFHFYWRTCGYVK